MPDMGTNRRSKIPKVPTIPMTERNREVPMPELLQTQKEVPIQKMFKRKNGMPLYLQVKEDLLARIENAQWEEDAMIPTEAELCEQYGVSKITMREAIKLLVADGKLFRIPGKGTFVTKHKLETRLNRFFSFTCWAKQNGLVPSTRIMKVETQECDSHIASHLKIKEGERVMRIERLRLGDNEPLMLEVIWISCKLCPNLHLQDLANVPLNDILTEKYNIPLIKTAESIEPAFADDYMRQMLGLGKNALLLLVEHTTYTIKDKVVYFVSSYYRGDRIKFTIVLDSKGTK